MASRRAGSGRGGRRWPTRLLVLLAGLSGLSGAVAAAEFRDLAVSRSGESFKVRFEAVVASSPDRVHALLTDFDRLHRLSPAIREAERLSPPGRNPARVRTVWEGCVAFFCRRMVRVEAVRSSDRRLIRSRILPGHSDFRSGHSRWELAAVSGGTRVRYRARLVPDFWLPPVVGPWALKRALRRSLRILVRRLERLAGQEDMAWSGQIGHHGRMRELIINPVVRNGSVRPR